MSVGQTEAMASNVPAKLKPGLAGYWIGSLVIVLGIAAAIAWGVVGFVGLIHSVDDFARVPAEGGGTVRLDDGDYVVYLESGSRTTGASGTDVSVDISDPDGESVNVRRYSTDLNYDFDDRGGVAVYTFTADSSGDYAVTSGLVSAAGPSSAELAIGPSLGGRLVRTIVIPFAIGGLALVVGIVLLIVTAVRRSGAKRRRDAETPRAFGGPGGFPPAGYPNPPGAPGPPPPFRG